MAQKWADQMIWNHDKNLKLMDGTQAGQNLWQSSSTSKRKFSVYHVKDAIKDWYDEVKYYNPRDIRSFRSYNFPQYFSKTLK